MRETMVRILHVALSSSREFDPKEPVEGFGTPALRRAISAPHRPPSRAATQEPIPRHEGLA